MEKRRARGLTCIHHTLCATEQLFWRKRRRTKKALHYMNYRHQCHWMPPTSNQNNLNANYECTPINVLKMHHRNRNRSAVPLFFQTFLLMLVMRRAVSSFFDPCHSIVLYTDWAFHWNNNSNNVNEKKNAKLRPYIHIT